MVVTTNGCFDLLNVGHVRSLKKAKSFGYLIVCLNSDKSVEKLKGRPPQNNECVRKEMLESLGCVDEVRIFDELEPSRILSEIKPDFHVKSKEGYKGLEKDAVEKSGKIILINNISYTTKLAKIKIYEKGGINRI